MVLSSVLRTHRFEPGEFKRLLGLSEREELESLSLDVDGRFVDVVTREGGVRELSRPLRAGYS